MTHTPEVLTDPTGPASHTPRAGVRRVVRAAAAALATARAWFRAWRRTRPFWGGLWTAAAGLWIIKAMSFSVGLALTGGWSYSAGYVMGGALVMLGLSCWFAPVHQGMAGVLGFLVALGAFPTANLGGYLVGSVLGVIGSSMIWAWGEKRPRKATRGAVTDGPRASGSA